MFKVYTIHGNGKKTLAKNFFVKIDRQVVWIDSDREMNELKYFSDEQINTYVGKSAYAKDLNKLKEGDMFDVQYGTCSNHYQIVKMTSKEIATLQDLEKKKAELQMVREEIEKSIPVELIQKEKQLKKELKELSKEVN